MKELNRDSIDAEYREKLTTQDYAPKDKIEGVEFVDLPHFVDDGGSFIEVARLTDGQHDWLHGVEARQVSYSEMSPGVVKGFHLHLKQDDVWFIPPSSRMLVVLHDTRESSASKGKTMRLVLGAGKAKLVKIPKGVAHGLKNIDDETGFVFYFVSQQFDKADPDEHRLPWDVLGAEIWDIIKG